MKQSKYKRCARCNQDKNHDEFHNSRNRPDGKDPYCKRCKSEYRLEKLGRDKIVRNPSREGYRICSRCGQEFPETAEYFGKPRKHVRKYGQGEYSYFRNDCLPCRSKRKIESAQRNRESTRTRQRRWDDAVGKKRKRDLYATDPVYRENAIKASLDFQVNNPEYVRARGANRRARKMNAEGTYTIEDIEAIYFEQEGRCNYCGETLHNEYHVDHYIPLARGGTNWPDNLVCACPPCNMSKGDKLFDEWKAMRGW